MAEKKQMSEKLAKEETEKKQLSDEKKQLGERTGQVQGQGEAY